MIQFNKRLLRQPFHFKAVIKRAKPFFLLKDGDFFNDAIFVKNSYFFYSQARPLYPQCTHFAVRGNKDRIFDSSSWEFIPNPSVLLIRNKSEKKIKKFNKLKVVVESYLLMCYNDIKQK